MNVYAAYKAWQKLLKLCQGQSTLLIWVIGDYRSRGSNVQADPSPGSYSDIVDLLSC